MPAAWATATGSAPIVAGWSTTTSRVPWTRSLSSKARSFASFCGRAFDNSCFPSRSTATAWWLCLPTSMPMNTSMSAWLVIMSLIFFDSCDRTFWLWFGWPVVLWLQGSASTLRSGSRHGFCQWFWPLSAISLVPSNPGDYTPRIMMTGGINHAGALRPATPFYPDGWWGYLKGNGGGVAPDPAGRRAGRRQRRGPLRRNALPAKGSAGEGLPGESFEGLDVAGTGLVDDFGRQGRRRGVRGLVP